MFEGVCVNYRHPAPRRGVPRVCSARPDSVSGRSGGSEWIRWIRFRTPGSPKSDDSITNSAHFLGKWDPMLTILLTLVVLGGKKAPAGMLIGNPSFSGEKKPLRACYLEIRAFLPKKKPLRACQPGAQSLYLRTICPYIHQNHAKITKHSKYTLPKLWGGLLWRKKSPCGHANPEHKAFIHEHMSIFHHCVLFYMLNFARAKPATKTCPRASLPCL